MKIPNKKQQASIGFKRSIPSKSTWNLWYSLGQTLPKTIQNADLTLYVVLEGKLSKNGLNLRWWITTVYPDSSASNNFCVVWMPHFIHVLCFGHPTSVSLKPLNEISNTTGGYLQNKGAFDLVSNFSGLLKSRLPGGFKYFSNLTI